MRMLALARTTRPNLENFKIFSKICRFLSTDPLNKFSDLFFALSVPPRSSIILQTLFANSQQLRTGKVFPYSVLVVAVPPFTVEIAKGDERLCFHLDLVESVDVQGEYGFRVEEFYVAPAAKEGDEDVPAEVYASSGIYIDPDFYDLLFVRYLEERGFDA
ncbi:unnamed protein product [Cylicocyclus nassatus]|uniref:Uncharacterized protein n=1 Tax=Cylicocyclus nassatus TaxID=53992 RepID=A0AA36DIZ7_CYLNA|nr:unnamed protein product [Cylicocyclus nassatus]